MIFVYKIWVRPIQGLTKSGYPSPPHIQWIHKIAQYLSALHTFKT